ncbi:MAG: ribbon-helix-helix domain-containing protein [Rhodoplanes sp.]
MKSPVVKRSIIIAGHETSSRMHSGTRLKEIAEEREMTLSDLVAAIYSQRQQSNLSSALRLFVLNFYRTQAFKLRRGATELTG